MAEEYLTDDEQWEAVKRWIVDNGLWIAAGVVLGVAGLVGYRTIESTRNERALRASVQFSEMTTALEQKDVGKSRQIADGLVKEYPNSPYADQARLLLARLFVDEGQLPASIAPLMQVMNHSKDSELKHIARLRLVRVLTAQGKPDEAIQALAEGAPGAFAALYHEARGDAFNAKKDFKSAVSEYKAALSGGDAGADSGLLELKIADLSTPAAAVAPNQAKP